MWALRRATCEYVLVLCTRSVCCGAWALFSAGTMLSSAGRKQSELWCVYVRANVSTPRVHAWVGYAGGDGVGGGRRAVAPQKPPRWGRCRAPTDPQDLPKTGLRHRPPPPPRGRDPGPELRGILGSGATPAAGAAGKRLRQRRRRPKRRRSLPPCSLHAGGCPP